MIDKILAAKSKVLEAQLAVLKAQVQKLGTSTAPHSFVDLYGILSGKVDSTEEEIDAAFLYARHRVTIDLPQVLAHTASAANCLVYPLDGPVVELIPLR